MEGTKKRLALNLSFLALGDFAKQISPRKSLKKFEEANGVVGLGIVAALNDYQRDEDPSLMNETRKGIGEIPPKFASKPIPIIGRNYVFNRNSAKDLCLDEMVLCEEYTCVTSHVGENLIEKREYFDAEFVEKSSESKWAFVTGEVCEAASLGGGGEIVPFVISDFLKSCFLCEKMLHGLDIFMYRGDKAFCSPECRHKQISMDEKQEKRRLRVKKQMEYSMRNFLRPDTRYRTIPLACRTRSLAVGFTSDGWIQIPVLKSHVQARVNDPIRKPKPTK